MQHDQGLLGKYTIMGFALQHCSGTLAKRNHMRLPSTVINRTSKSIFFFSPHHPHDTISFLQKECFASYRINVYKHVRTNVWIVWDGRGRKRGMPEFYLLLFLWWEGRVVSSLPWNFQGKSSQNSNQFEIERMNAHCSGITNLEHPTAFEVVLRDVALTSTKCWKPLLSCWDWIRLCVGYKCWGSP